jgi:phosphatidylglycerol:prolipoprotein diacylglycerol transferase
MNPITFPGLGLELHIQRVAFNLFGKDVYWYGIIIAFGFLVAVLYCQHFAKHFGIPSSRVLDFILFAAPGGIIGARIYYVIFYASLYRKADGSFDWKEAISIWDGGLAIYGGIIASVLILFLFCRATKLKFSAFADLGSYGLFIGQAIGRWGNFCNQEAFGAQTTLPWRMGLTVYGTYMEVHPTFLYESLWNLIGLAIAHFFLRKRRTFDGEIFLFYLSWYGLGRVWIEGLRTDSLYLFGTGIRVSQLLALLCLILAGGALLLIRFKGRPDPARMYVHQVAEVAPAETTAPIQTADQPTDENTQHNEEEESNGSSDH